MSEKKDDSLAEQIKSAREAVDKWPEWMKSVAYVSSTSLSESSARKGFEESGQVVSPNPKAPNK